MNNIKEVYLTVICSYKTNHLTHFHIVLSSVANYMTE